MGARVVSFWVSIPILESYPDFAGQFNEGSYRYFQENEYLVRNLLDTQRYRILLFPAGLCTGRRWHLHVFTVPLFAVDLYRGKTLCSICKVREIGPPMSEILTLTAPIACAVLCR